MNSALDLKNLKYILFLKIHQYFTEYLKSAIYLYKKSELKQCQTKMIWIYLFFIENPSIILWICFWKIMRSADEYLQRSWCNEDILSSTLWHQMVVGLYLMSMFSYCFGCYFLASLGGFRSQSVWYGNDAFLLLQLWI